MASRLDYYFRQRVTEAELDLGFELLEKADQAFATDIGVFGIIDGMVPSEHAPVPDITLDLTAPGRCYDQLGQRIFFGTAQNVDISNDLNAVSTAVQSSGNEKWLSLLVQFDRLLSDPRTDGNSQQVYFRREEAFKFVVRQGAEAPSGTATRPPLQADEVLICDVLRTYGQTQILNADIYQDRRQKFVFAEAEKISVFTGGFNTLSPTDDEVQATFQEVDDELTDHFGATARRHTAADINFSPYSYVAATQVQNALKEIIDDLASQSAGSAGAIRVGADVVSGSPNALSAGTVDAQLAALLGHINDHENQATGAHAASAVSYPGHSYVTSTNVDAAIDELIDDLASSTAGSAGASRVGADAVSASPNSLSAGSVDAQITALLGHINDHENAATGAHAASAISNAPSGGIAATTVQAAINELDTEKSNTGHGHAATEITYAGSGNFADGTSISGQSVEGALDTIVSLLADQVGAGSDGAGRVGAEAQSYGASSVARGDISSQILTLLQLIDGKASTGVANTWSQPQTFSGDPGLQYPTTSAMRLLLYVPSSTAPLRIYADLTNVWITLNAEWTGTQWQASTAGNFRSAFRIYRTTFYFYHQGTDPDTWVDWQYGLALNLSATTKEFVDVGTEGIRQRAYTGQEGYCNGTSGAGGSWNYPFRFAASPSTVTFTQTSKSPTTWDTEPSIWYHDETGGTWFGYPGNTGTFWYSGRVTAY